MTDGSTARRLLALVCGLALAASGVFGTAFWVGRDRGPSLESFEKAAAVVRAGFKPGDLIVLVPFYATRARRWLGDLEPVAVRDPLAEDLSIHPSVWIFGIFGEAEKLRPRMLAAGLELEPSGPAAAGITVDHYQVRAPEVAVYSFVDHLREAKVQHEKDGATTRCGAWTDLNGQNGRFGRWQCPYDSEWFYVAPEWHRMGEEMRFCLWAHPPNQGRLLISYPNVPLSGHLYGRAGHTLNSSAFARAPVNLDVQIGDLEPQRFTFQLKDTQKPFMLALPGTGTATVTFAVSTDDAGTNHFCFSADVRRP
jgi:hypothetical protein